MSWHYLPGLAVDFSVEPCSGGEPWLPSRLKSIHGRFYCNGKPTESYLDSLSGTMCEHSTGNPGEERSMSSPEDSLARTSAQPGKEPESRGNVPVYGLSLPASSAKFDRPTSLWRTHPCLFPEDSMLSSVTLPRWGTMRNGVLSERTMPAHLTKETEFGYWRSPDTGAVGTSGVHKAGQDYRENGQPVQVRIVDQMNNPRLWPTPVASLWKAGSAGAGFGPNLLDAVKQQWRTPAAKEPGVSPERLVPIDGGEPGGMNRHFDKETGRMAQIGLAQQIALRAMWPTPKASSAGPDIAKLDRSKTGVSLQTAVALWPTPTASEDAAGTPAGKMQWMLTQAVKSGCKSRAEYLGGTETRQTYPTPGALQRGAHKGTKAGEIDLEKQQRTSEAGVSYGATLQTIIGSGQLNPDWVEWLMGWPIGWSDLKPLGMDKFLLWLRSHGRF
jgi:hypothetical protein